MRTPAWKPTHASARGGTKSQTQASVIQVAEDELEDSGLPVESEDSEKDGEFKDEDGEDMEEEDEDGKDTEEEDEDDEDVEDEENDEDGEDDDLWKEVNFDHEVNNWMGAYQMSSHPSKLLLSPQNQRERFQKWAREVRK